MGAIHGEVRMVGRVAVLRLRDYRDNVHSEGRAACPSAASTVRSGLATSRTYAAAFNIKLKATRSSKRPMAPYATAAPAKQIARLVRAAFQPNESRLRSNGNKRSGDNRAIEMLRMRKARSDCHKSPSTSFSPPSLSNPTTAVAATQAMGATIDACTHAVTRRCIVSVRLLGTLGVLRHVVGDLKPWRLRADEDVRRRLNPWVVV